MDIKIVKVILWPKKLGETRREINFNGNKINVIVGDSQTGKSSIIPIVDYCFGSNKCAIPVGPIRDCTQWFGILVKHNNTHILLCRKEPGVNYSTSEMYYDEGTKLNIPQQILQSNRTSKEVVNRLNQLSRLPNLDFSDNELDKKAYEERPSFKDFLAFCFQPQHIIANPYTLFYKADTIEHRFKLQTIFPLALGLIRNETLEHQKRQKLLKDEYRRLQGILEEKKKIKNAWDAEIKANYLQALELGILKNVPFPEDDWKLEDYVFHLSQILRPNQILSPQYTEGLSSRIIAYKTRLEKKEKGLLDDIDDRKYRLHQIRNFNEITLGYRSAVQSQRGRLELAYNGWLKEKLKSENTCPVCGSIHEKGNKDIHQLIKISENLNSKLANLNETRGLLDKEATILEREIAEVEKTLNNVRNELENLGRQNEQIEKQQRSIENTYRYIGRIEQNLKNLNEINEDSNLMMRLQELSLEIERLQILINQTNNKHLEEDVLKRISQNIILYKEILKVENFSNPTRLDIKELTLRISSPKTGKEDYLWEIGSGSNWMGFHISTLLAIHEFCLSLKLNNHVPSFIFLDQPSQAYFPEAIKDNEQAQKDSDDLVRVKAIFQAVAEFRKRTNRKVQVIILEHASHDIWGDIKGTQLIDNARWDKDNALIPESWFSE